MREKRHEIEADIDEKQALFVAFLYHGMSPLLQEIPVPSALSLQQGQRHAIPVATLVHEGSGKVEVSAEGGGNERRGGHSLAGFRVECSRMKGGG